MSANQFYIGLGTFEDLLDLKVFPDDELLLDNCIENIPSNHLDVKFKKFSIVAARIDRENGLCYYWRFQTGGVYDWGLVDEKLDAAQVRTLEALQVLRRYAAEVRDFKIVRGFVATPKDFVLLDGTTALVRYDKETDLFLSPTDMIS